MSNLHGINFNCTKVLASVSLDCGTALTQKLSHLPTINLMMSQAHSQPSLEKDGKLICGTLTSVFESNTSECLTVQVCEGQGCKALCQMPVKGHPAIVGKPPKLVLCRPTQESSVSSNASTSVLTASCCKISLKIRIVHFVTLSKIII